MATFFLRDDDANATTDPARLERAYAPLLDAGLPLTFSVIPRVGLDTLAPDGQPERFLPPHLAGQRGEVALCSSSPLAGWLRASRGQCQAAQHGLDHRRVRGGTEFGALSRSEAAARIEEGRSLLAGALGARPLGFVAPWDALSAGALEAAVERFPLVSTSWLDRGRLPPRWWPAHAVERLWRSERLRLGGSLVLRHRGGPVGGSLPPDQVASRLDDLGRGAEVAVVVLHHWMFWGSDEPHPVVRALGRALRGRRVASLSELAGPGAQRAA